MQEVEATIINGKGTETGHIIVTTTGGKNGQPKQVSDFTAFDRDLATIEHVFSVCMNLIIQILLDHGQMCFCF
jgi:hypothetical protein